MGWELHENAVGVDFDGAVTQDCFFRLGVQKWRFCAASLAVNPLFGPSGSVLEKLGAVDGNRIVDEGEVWRLVTALFLHGGVVHLCLNMLALLAVGRQLEHSHGSLRVGAIYLLSGLFGALASAIFAPTTLSVGASGAIFGLIGACLGDILLNWDLYPKPCLALLWLTLISLFQLLLGTMPLLDNFAHAFGFVMGLVSSIALLQRRSPTKHSCITYSRRFIRIVAGCCVLAAFVLAVGLLYGVGGSDADELCPHCAKISCMPFPWGCDPEKPQDCWWTCTTEQSAASF